MKRDSLAHRWRAWFSKPSNVLLLAFLIALFCLSVLPLATMLSNMFTVHQGTEKKLLRLAVGSFTWSHFKRMFSASEWSTVNFWIPLKNSFIVATGSGLLGILFGGTVAWFITRSNMKFKKFISAVFLFPYIMPAWTLALFWVNLFQNSKVGGGNVGMFESLFGICMPEWFVFGLFQYLKNLLLKIV